MERQGRRAGSIVTEASCRAPSADAALALGLTAGAEVWHITRIRLADGEPVALETTEVVAEGTPDLLRKADFGRMSLYAVLQEHFGLRPATAEQTLAAAAADASVAVPLGIELGAPVLRLTRLTRDAAGRPFEHVRSHYRGDAFVMKVRLELGEG
jgi:GntR family transcriptional regulator